MQVIIALDQGSSSSRALAIDERGRVVARARFPVETEFPRAGWVEHEAADLALTSERALDAVLARLPRKAEVLGLGLACQRSTVVLWDRQTGRAACAAPSWQDARGSAVSAGMQERQPAVHEKTGLYLTPFYSAPKIRFLLDHEPKARALLEEGRLLIAPVSSYLLWRLSKGESLVVDPTMAQRTLLFNIRDGAWDPELLSWFGVPKDCLPAVSPTSGLLGIVKRKGRKIPVLAMIGDQQSAAYGQGGEPGVGVLNYGTGAFFLLNTGASQHRVPGLLTSVAWQRQGAASDFFLEGTVHAAGTSFEWLRKNLGLLADVREADALCGESTHRVLALQAIGGLGAPRWDYQTPTTYMGLTARTKPADLVRSVAESIAFLLADIVTSIQAAGLPVEDVRASGGVARMDYLLQFQADLIQRPISRLREREATAMGVAALAAEQAGAPWASGLRAPATEMGFRPLIGREDAERLLAGWRLFVDGQQKLAAELRRLGFPFEDNRGGRKK